jgi:hypothetical protein
MNNRLTGALFLSAAGMIAALGTAGAQIAYAIVLGGFYAGHATGAVPPGPQTTSPHWIVVVSIVVLAAFGLYFLFWEPRAKGS